VGNCWSYIESFDPSREQTREERDVLALRKKKTGWPRRDEELGERADIEKQDHLLVIGRLQSIFGENRQRIYE
jgi:hypothetical protein